MHSILLGVVKKLLEAWFSIKFKLKPWYIGHSVNILDKKLRNIKTPNFIGRIPRSFNDLKRWKASEYKSFLFFYSAPVLWKTFPDIYYQYFLCLVEPIHILLSESISKEALQKASLLLKKINVQLRSLYGEQYQTFNAYNILHLVFCVKNFGPLWSFSCFSYEDYNGHLRNLFHGTQHIALQVITPVCFQEKIPEILPILHYKSKESLLFEKLYFKSYHKIQTNLIEEINGTASGIGLQKTFKPVGWERRVIEKSFQFQRLLHNKKVFHCKYYKRVDKRNSYIVCYKSNDSINFGLVIYYLRDFIQCPVVSFYDSSYAFHIPKFIAIIEKLVLFTAKEKDRIEKLNLQTKLIKKKPRPIDCCLVKDLHNICLLVDSEKFDFSFEFPNNMESD